MSRDKLFYIIVVIILIVAGVMFRFSFLSENGMSPSPEQLNNQPEAVLNNIPIIESPAIDYSKIFEKYKGKDAERALTDKKLIAFTFDGGGNDDGTEKILRTLSDNSIRSTFFLTGKFVEKFPGAVEEIKKSGGETANHTYSHKNFTQLGIEEVTQEINQMKAVAEKMGIALAPFFRFPYGAYKKEDIRLVNDLGYVSTRWTIDSLGWQGRRDGRDPPSPEASDGRSAKFVVDRVVEKAVPGAIVLMHLGSAADGSTFDADALPDIIAALKEQDYQFATLSELFAESL